MRKLFSLSVVLTLVALCAAAPPAFDGASAAGDPKAIYAQKCAKCHLADGKGLASLQPPDFTDAKWQASRKDAQMLATMNSGKGTMPAFKGAIPAADIKLLIRYVRAFAPAKKK